MAMLSAARRVAMFARQGGRRVVGSGRGAQRSVSAARVGARSARTSGQQVGLLDYLRASASNPTAVRAGRRTVQGVQKVRRIGSAAPGAVASSARARTASVRDRLAGGYSSAAYNTRGFVRRNPKKFIAGGIGLGAVGGAEAYRRKRNRRSF